jgi:hypothetical protein
MDADALDLVKPILTDGNRDRIAAVLADPTNAWRSEPRKRKVAHLRQRGERVPANLRIADVDTRLERVMGEDDLVPTNWLRRGLRVADAVALIRQPDPATGFLVSDSPLPRACGRRSPEGLRPRGVMRRSCVRLRYTLAAASAASIDAAGGRARLSGPGARQRSSTVVGEWLFRVLAVGRGACAGRWRPHRRCYIPSPREHVCATVLNPDCPQPRRN